MPILRTSRAALGQRGALLAISIVIVVLGAADGYSSSQYWNASSSNLSFAQAEQRGALYLGPLTKLLAALEQAQNAAVVSGAQPGPAVTTQVAAVNAADQNEGSQLGTHTSWNELRSRIAALGTQDVSASAAFTAYDEVTRLTIALITQVGDSSNLILDPEFDSYYLVDTLILRIPTLIVDAGQFQDLADLTGAAGSAVCGAPDCVPEIFALRQQISTTATELESGLEKAYSSTNSSTLGPQLLGSIDGLRAEVAQVAPAAELIDLPTVVPSPAAAASQSAAMSAALLQLDGTGVSQLQDLLGARVGGIENLQTRVAFVGVAGFVLVLCVVVVITPRRRRPVEEDGEGEPGAFAQVDEEDLRLLDPRELLASGELFRVGRAVTGRHSHRAGDQQ